MKILLVNNGSRHLSSLKKLLKPSKIVPWTALDGHYGGFDLVVLSGGHALTVSRHERTYAKEIQLIKIIKIPIIGICLGSELIAHIFGARLSLLKRRDHGIRVINDLINGQTYRVYEAHRWAVTKIPKILKKIAVSKDGIEIFRHKTRPIFGLQFHPEILVRKTDGQKIFRHILAGIKKP